MGVKSSLSILFIFITLCNTALAYSGTPINPETATNYYVGATRERIALYENTSAVNPTYEQLIAFIKQDETDKREYIHGNYTCGDFAEDVYNNAQEAGYRCAWVAIEFENLSTGHSCNLFNTSDKGLIYIDCTGGSRDHMEDFSNWDRVVSVDIGYDYAMSSLYDDQDWSSVGLMGATNVSKIDIFWGNNSECINGAV